MPFSEREGNDAGWLDDELIPYLRKQLPDPEDAPEDYWRLARREESMRWWKFLESTRDAMSGQWSFLPYPGGWGDQPDWLVHDLTLIGEYASMLREQLKSGHQVEV